MLLKIRDAITGWMAYVVIAVLIVPFALWGIGDYLGVFGENYAAKVGDTEIPLTDYREAYNQRFTQVRDSMGADFRHDLIDEPALRQETLEFMINEELLYQYAIDRGFRVSDARLVREIHDMEAFQDNGVFDPERYRYLLQLSGHSPTTFENAMRRSLVISQLTAAISGTAFLPQQRFDEIVRVADQRRQFGWVEVAAATFYDDVALTDEQVAEYYEANRGRFMTPETLTVEYLELDAAQAAAQVPVDEEQLREFYDERRQAAAGPEERRASHILLTDEARSDRDARQLAEELRARIDDGEDFDALAREYSDDPESAREGGDLGWVERGLFPREFDRALFDLAEGEVSQPVRTGFGWHLLRVDELREHDFPPFDEMRDELADEYRRVEAERRFYDRVDRAADLAFESPESLEPAAQAAGVEIQRVEGVTRNSGPGLMRDARMRNAAFSPEVLEQGYNSNMVELDDDRVAIVRVEERHPPRQRELGEVEAQIRDSMIRAEARRLAAELGAEIQARAEAGEDLAALAEEFDVEWYAPRPVGRSDPATPQPLLSAVFRAPLASPAAPVVDGMQLGDDYVVYRLVRVIPGSPLDLDADQRTGLMQVLTERVGTREMQALLENIRARTDVSYGSNLFDDDTVF